MDGVAATPEWDAAVMSAELANSGGSPLNETALLLLGHGSTLNADSSAPTYQHAEELRRRGIFADVGLGGYGFRSGSDLKRPGLGLDWRL